MLKIALKHKTNYVCIVPEKRAELTTEGGLNLHKKKSFLKKMIRKLKKNKTRVSLFINPKISDVKISNYLGANCVEIHTGKYCRALHNKKNIKYEFLKIKKTADLAAHIGMDVHAGHGLTYKSAYNVSRIKSISEFNIGHFIVSESIFIGLKKSIKKIINIINK